MFLKFSMSSLRRSQYSTSFFIPYCLAIGSTSKYINCSITWAHVYNSSWWMKGCLEILYLPLWSWYVKKQINPKPQTLVWSLNRYPNSALWSTKMLLQGMGESTDSVKGVSWMLLCWASECWHHVSGLSGVRTHWTFSCLNLLH